MTKYMNSFSIGKWLSSFHIKLVIIYDWDLGAKLISMDGERNIHILIFFLVDEYITILSWLGHIGTYRIYWA